jgi:hypothetical protein
MPCLASDHAFFDFWNKLYAKIWYVWMGKKLDNASCTARYIGRYAKRPAMAESRIKGYDGSMVTFEYQDKSEKVYQTETLPVYDFLGRLIRHIHDKHYRVIRYAGIFSVRTKREDCATARRLLLQAPEYPRSPLSWRERRMQQEGYDPLVCRFCGRTMVLKEVWYRSRDGPLKKVGSGW